MEVNRVQILYKPENMMLNNYLNDKIQFVLYRTKATFKEEAENKIAKAKAENKVGSHGI